MAPVDADRNLLFGVLALQGDLIDTHQFAEACTAWSLRKDRPLADQLVERGWLQPEDRRLIERLLEQKIKKHGGDPHQSLIAAARAPADTMATLAEVGSGSRDAEIRRSLADFSSARSPTGTIDLLARLSPSSGRRDRYTLTSLHAQGGIGQVWLARDTEMDREIALKELRADRTGDDVLLRRFFQEARVTGQLDHPGVVPVYELARGEAGAGAGRPYYTMRFVRGRTLSDAVALYHKNRTAGQARRSDLLALLQAFVGVCNTVAFAHSKGVIHRDLKGSNIILGEFGEVVLLDWGLAKLVDREAHGTEPAADFDPMMTAPHGAAPEQPGFSPGLTSAGAVMGTPAYMAPEQAEGRADRIGRKTDVYGLGTILYEILTGHAPFEGRSIDDVLRKVREEPPDPPRKLNRSIGKDLEAICTKAMAKDPAARYDSAGELASDVRHSLADEPVSAWREPWTTRARRFLVRHRTEVAAGVAALGVAVVGLSAALLIQSRANRDLQASLEREVLARQDETAQSAQAEEAIEAFYKGISEEVLLQRPEFEKTRDRLLGAALRFYEKRVDYLTDKRLGGGRAIQTIGYGLDRIASLQSILGQREAAIATRRRQVELYDATPQLATDNAAEAQLNLGNLQRLAGRPEDAERSIRDALSRMEKLNYEPKVALVQADLGRLLFDVGKSAEGRALLERAQATQERLGARGRAGRDLAATYTTLGNLQEAEGRPTEALDLYKKALAIYEDAAARNPGPYFQAELARALNNLGLARAHAGKPDEGLRDVMRGEKIRARLLADQPSNIEYRADLARSYYHLARIHSLSRAVDQANASIRKAEELYVGIPPKGPEDIYFRACMRALRSGLSGTGKPQEVLSPSERHEQKQDADEAMALLKRAAAAGYANPTRFKTDPPLESIRSRPDFQELVRSLGSSSARVRLEGAG
jgi:serine/threonine-protein kinase